MNTESTFPIPHHPQAIRQDETEPHTSNASSLEDDLGLDGEPLGARQENAIQIITCEGGCE